MIEVCRVIQPPVPATSKFRQRQIISSSWLPLDRSLLTLLQITCIMYKKGGSLLPDQLRSLRCLFQVDPVFHLGFHEKLSIVQLPEVEYSAKSTTPLSQQLPQVDNPQRLKIRKVRQFRKVNGSCYSKCIEAAVPVPIPAAKLPRHSS